MPKLCLERPYLEQERACRYLGGGSHALGDCTAQLGDGCALQGARGPLLRLEKALARRAQRACIRLGVGAGATRAVLGVGRAVRLALLARAELMSQDRVLTLEARAGRLKLGHVREYLRSRTLE